MLCSSPPYVEAAWSACCVIYILSIIVQPYFLPRAASLERQGERVLAYTALAALLGSLGLLQVLGALCGAMLRCAWHLLNWPLALALLPCTSCCVQLAAALQRLASVRPMCAPTLV